MRYTIILLALVMFVPISCVKEQIDLSQTADTQTSLEQRGPNPKIDICHYDQVENKWISISINMNAWKGHEKHGDIRLDDQDNDGYYPYNECGFGPMGDCDDTDPSINPCTPDCYLQEVCVCDGCPAYTYEEIIAIADLITGWALPNPRNQWVYSWSGGPNFGVDEDDFFAINPNGSRYGSLTSEEVACCIEIIQTVADYLGISYAAAESQVSNYFQQQGAPLFLDNIEHDSQEIDSGF